LSGSIRPLAKSIFSLLTARGSIILPHSVNATDNKRIAGSVYRIRVDLP
jgi:hypothetical protein